MHRRRRLPYSRPGIGTNRPARGKSALKKSVFTQRRQLIRVAGETGGQDPSAVLGWPGGPLAGLARGPSRSEGCGIVVRPILSALPHRCPGPRGGLDCFYRDFGFRMAVALR